jgi:hypothetical protein
MTDAERARAWEAAAQRQMARLAAMEDATAAEIEGWLTEAKRLIGAALTAQPSEFEAWRLGQLQAEVARHLNTAGGQAGQSLVAGIDAAAAGGAQLVTQPLAAVGVELGSSLVAIPDRQLQALKSFCTSKMRDVTSEVIGRVNNELVQAVIGTQSPWQAAQNIAGQVDGGMKRALTITRTEMGRAQAMATQRRLEQAVGEVPGLQKQWRKSNKLHPRITHELADGQIVDVDRPFSVGGARLMFPRDPNAPAKEVVNCGCTSLPYMSDWAMVSPMNLPVPPDEANRTAARRRARDVRDADFKQWTAAAVDGTAPVGSQRVVTGLPARVVDELSARGLAPLSRDVLVGDGQIAAMARGRGKLDKATILQLPEVIETGAAYVDLERPDLVHFVGPAGTAGTVRVSVDMNAGTSVASAAVMAGEVPKRWTRL